MSLKPLGWALLLLSSGVLAQERGAVGGRIVFADGSDLLTPRQAQKALGGEPITLEIRNADLVIDAKLEPDGYFVVDAPEGTYRLEYVGVGDKAEFIPAQLLEVKAGALTCVGTLEVDTGGIELLGSNSKNSLRVGDDCEQALPRLRKLTRAPREERQALARSGPRVEHEFQFDLLDRLEEIRVEGYFSDIGAVGRLSYMHLFSPLHRYVLPVAYVSGASGAYILPGSFDEYGAYEVVGGAGLRLIGISVVGFGGMRLSRAAAIPGGPVAGGLLHLNGGWWGTGFRYEVLPQQGWAWTFDIAPIALLGSLL